MEADLRRLRIFLTVADTLHFGRAAQQLRLAQPSISQQVARLERQLGCLLFLRTSRGVTLTAAGQQLAHQVGPAVRSLDEALAAFSASTASEGRLRVGALSSLAGSLIPTAVADVAASPLRVSIAEGSLSLLIQRLHGGDLDELFCYSTNDATIMGDGCVVRTLDERATRIALPESDPAAGRREISWGEAASRPWIMPSASRQYYEDMLERFARRGLAVRVVAEASTLPGQLALVAAGIGWTFTSPWAPAPPHVWLAEPIDAERLKLFAVTRATGVTDIGQALIDAVATRAREVAPWPPR